MSYASGFMVGTSIGKAVYDMFHNKKGKAAAAAAPAGVCRSQVQAAKPAAAVPRFACVSVLKGRRRYRAAALVGNAESATYLKAVQDTADVFSQAIFRKSKAFLDLRTLIAVVLTLRGLRKTVFLGQRPTGPQMLWWALSLLRRR